MAQIFNIWERRLPLGQRFQSDVAIPDFRSFGLQLDFSFFATLGFARHHEFAIHPVFEFFAFADQFGEIKNITDLTKYHRNDIIMVWK